MQIGPVRTAEGPTRMMLPDFELDFGLTRDVELDIDGAWSLRGRDGTAFAQPTSAPDNLWIATKLALTPPESRTRMYSLRLQLGPRLPLAEDAHGLGYEALVLLGLTVRSVKIAFNAGGVIDAGAEIGRDRPTAVQGGVDVSTPLAPSLALLGEVGGTRYVSADPHEVHVTAGLSWTATPGLDLSLVGLVGFLDGADRRGLLLGVTRNVALVP